MSSGKPETSQCQDPTGSPIPPLQEMYQGTKNSAHKSQPGKQLELMMNGSGQKLSINPRRKIPEP